VGTLAIKPPVWKPQVPWYFFTGGLTGAASTFALLAEIAGHDRLARRASAVAMLAGTASPALLITDLGRPERFLNMLRLVTSPMSVGSWVVARRAQGTLCDGLARLGEVPRRGGGPRSARLSGLPMATYTAVLIAGAACRVGEARHELLFRSRRARHERRAAVAIATPRRLRLRRSVMIGARGVCPAARWSGVGR
jgi:hypothetical protein